MKKGVIVRGFVTFGVLLSLLIVPNSAMADITFDFGSSEGGAFAGYSVVINSTSVITSITVTPISQDHCTFLDSNATNAAGYSNFTGQTNFTLGVWFQADDSFMGEGTAIVDVTVTNQENESALYQIGFTCSPQ